MNIKKTALIVGGNGIVGRNLTSYLESSDLWHVIVTSHSPLNYKSNATFVQLDLTDTNAIDKQKEILKNVTHVFYGAYIERESLAMQTQLNFQLLENLIIGIEKVAPNFKYISFIQGAKAYGAHLGMYKTPAKETDARHFPPNFYYSQEDFLREHSRNKNWTWTALRPDIVIGIAIGNPMNLATLIAVYATLCKELNIPMRFPGNSRAYKALVNVTDATLLAKGMEYTALNDKCNNEIFNVTNGDIFRWEELWPKFGKYFNIDIAEPQTFSLSEYMKDKADLWKSIVDKYDLIDSNFESLAHWKFGDFIFNNQYDAFQDVNKFRRFGFHEMQVDTFSCFKGVFKQLKEARIISE